MKVIIAGSRSITDEKKVFKLLDDAQRYYVRKFTTVVSGGARGVDKIGEKWAELNNIEVQRFPADWDKYGKRAGIIRNNDMAKEADGLICVWDGKSRGSKHM